MPSDFMHKFSAEVFLRKEGGHHIAVRRARFREFTDYLRSIDFPKHTPTYKAALEGWPNKEDACPPEVAADIGRICMFTMLQRWYVSMMKK